MVTEDRLRKTAAVVVSASLVGVLVASALAAQGDTTLVSRQSAGAGGGSTDEFSFLPAISATGRSVAFESEAENLSDADVTARDIFVRDVKGETTILASRRSGAAGAGAADASEEASISAAGRSVAFESEADNLSGKDKDAFDNIFVRDLERNRTILVSRRSQAAGGGGGNGDSSTPSISGNGRFVAFSSEATNLSGADNPVYDDVFVRDLKQKRTALISRRSGARGRAGNEASFTPELSADGRFVAFASRAENLSAVDVASQDVFVRNLKRERTLLASRRSAAAGGEAADEGSGSPSISADGRFVAFSSGGENLSGADQALTDVFVRDLKRERTVLASRQSSTAGGQGGDDVALTPSISGDGRFVAFHSGADNLTGDDDDDVTNVYVRALEDKQTTLASMTSNGLGADGDSASASISGDGRFIAFSSDAANLSDADAHDMFLGDLYTDVFRHDLLGP